MAWRDRAVKKKLLVLTNALCHDIVMDIKALIRQRGLKQVWIARQLDMDEGHLSNMLTGRKLFPTDKIGSLAKLLGASKKDVELGLAELREGWK